MSAVHRQGRAGDRRRIGRHGAGLVDGRGPAVTPNTVNTPLAVDGTYTAPAQTPFCVVPDTRGRSVDTSKVVGPVPDVRRSQTFSGMFTWLGSSES